MKFPWTLKIESLEKLCQTVIDGAKMLEEKLAKRDEEIKVLKSDIADRDEEIALWKAKSLKDMEKLGHSLVAFEDVAEAVRVAMAQVNPATPSRNLAIGVPANTTAYADELEKWKDHARKNHEETEAMDKWSSVYDPDAKSKWGTADLDGDESVPLKDIGPINPEFEKWLATR
jgi:hypothetical protein